MDTSANTKADGDDLELYAEPEDLDKPQIEEEESEGENDEIYDEATSAKQEEPSIGKDANGG